MLQADGEPVLASLVKLFNGVLSQGVTPGSWKNAVVGVLHKTGDKTNLTN